MKRTLGWWSTVHLHFLLFPLAQLQSPWVWSRRAVHAGKLCGVQCLGWSAEEKKGHVCVVALGLCCLLSFLGAFRSLRFCSAGYCRFIKPKWLQHNARQERGRDWTWTLATAQQAPANQDALMRQDASSSCYTSHLNLPAYLTLIPAASPFWSHTTSFTVANSLNTQKTTCLFPSHNTFAFFLDIHLRDAFLCFHYCANLHVCTVITC